MTFVRASGLLGSIAVLLLCAPAISAQGWEDERYHLSMQTPRGWVPMSKALLAETNTQVSHVTGRGFIAGYSPNQGEALVFPYMLVQFKPYTALPKQYRPKTKPDERGQLELLYALVSAFRQRGPLPATIDIPQFMDGYGNDRARLVRLEDGGRFDFTGKIPHEVGGNPIQYHTHGLFGRDGIAIVSVFAMEHFSGLSHIIRNQMRTLALQAGYGIDGLPDPPPAPEPAAGQTAGPGLGSAQAPVAAEPVPVPVDAVDTQAQTTDPPTRQATNPANSKALLMILLLLGTVLLGVMIIVWYVTHNKAQARRERSRARRERLRASQGTAQVSHQAYPAEPVKARSHGSSGRRRHGTTRS